jgi:hypothetical protein
VECPNIHNFYLSNFDVTESSIIRLAQGCPHLQNLDVSKSPEITDASIIKLAEGYPYVTRLA